ncbi:MAG: orotidine 5'-phosphate decarboxylase / HUMPS family protein, partial [Candidatus Nanoarchaeia archaeon]
KAVMQMIRIGRTQCVDGFISSGYDLRDQAGQTPVFRREDGVVDAPFSEITCFDVMPYGLEKAVKAIRQYTQKPIVYDHQKAGTHLPGGATAFASICKTAGADTVILFPQAGPTTEVAYIEAAQKAGLGVIVGGLMTHPNYVAREGGYVADGAPLRIYDLAGQMNVADFVVPGNRPDDIRDVKAQLESQGIEPTFWAPGFLKKGQGGNVTEGAAAAGKNFKAIVGRGIKNAPDMRQAAIDLVGLL